MLRRVKGSSRHRLRLALVCLAAVIALAGRWGWNERDRGSRICLVGNAETDAKALSVYRQWGGAFPAAFYVWGQRRTDDEVRSRDEIRRVSFLRPREGEEALPFADGMFASVNEVMSRHRCDYIFTHDDDLEFTVAPHGNFYDPSAPRANIAAELQYVLDVYRPAIAGFPWKVGDERFEGMKALKKEYATEEVAPLTGFDNGMVIYHKSVLPLFFPFSPNGEGGFTGKWTLGAHFLQASCLMFGPLIFREHALRLNTLPYDNTVNMDNIPKGQGKTEIRNGLAYVPSSRHPYEYPLNDAYMSFLSSGLRDRQQPWGRTLGPKDVSVPQVWAGGDYEPEWILNRLDEFYDIRHEALSRTRLIQSIPAPKLELLAARNPPRFAVRIIMFTKNRLRSFQRCWESVRTAFPIEGTDVSVDVHLDYDPAMSKFDRDEYDAYLELLKRDPGPAQSVTVFKSTKEMGLRASILSSWTPRDNHEYAIFLEDDIEVSPHFLRYAQNMIDAYVYRDHADHRLSAISLYNIRYNEALESFVSVKNGHRPYIYQQAQSWGAIFLPENWRRFTTYVKRFPAGKDPLIPDSLTNRWPFAQSWKKYYMRFMAEEGGYVIYPNLPGGQSYSTNYVEVGTNDKVTQLAAQKIIHAKFRVPLLPREANFHSLQVYPPLSSLEVYTMQHQALEHVDLFPRGTEHVESFDKCTMIMTVYSRVETFLDRIEHYHTLDRLGQILIVWNNVDYPPPAISSDDYNIPVEILKMERNSLNNRFHPWPQIKYSCCETIANSHDPPTDWDMPHEHIKYAVDVWKGHFWDHLVGFYHQGRNHVVREIDGKDVTLYSSTFLSPQLLAGKKPFYSIVLPSGFIYHRKYLDMYTHQLPQEARDYVDEVANCDDLLFNYMMANATGTGPALIEAWASMVLDLGNAGLWSRPTHMGVRTECMARFERIFGRNPLKYTTTIFSIQYKTTVPGLHHYTMSDTIPFDYPCNKTVYETSEQCAFVMEKEHWGKAGGWA
ncbi:glycosyl transferase family 64 domain-containing protein [Rhodotorula toruloides]